MTRHKIIDWAPDEVQLRRFGYLGLAGFPLLGLAIFLLAPESEAMGIAIVFGGLALACGLFALLAPARLKPIYLLVAFLGAVVLFPVFFIGRIFGGKAENLPDDGNPD